MLAAAPTPSEGATCGGTVVLRSSRDMCIHLEAIITAAQQLPTGCNNSIARAILAVAGPIPYFRFSANPGSRGSYRKTIPGPAMGGAHQTGAPDGSRTAMSAPAGSSAAGGALVLFENSSGGGCAVGIAHSAAPPRPTGWRARGRRAQCSARHAPTLARARRAAYRSRRAPFGSCPCKHSCAPRARE